MHPSLRGARLYGILDSGYVAPDEMPRVLGAMIAGGIDLVQLRAKNCSEQDVADRAPNLWAMCREAGIPFVINDHPGLSHLADGIHVGQDDAMVATAREMGARLVGKSTHSLSQAEAAQAEGADYIGFGPLFPTPTKAGRPAIGLHDIAEVHRRVTIPIFCIGGVNRDTLPNVIAAGARRVVIVSGILQAVDIREYVADCKALLASPN